MADLQSQLDTAIADRSKASGADIARLSTLIANLQRQIQVRAEDIPTGEQLLAETAAETAATPIRTLQNVADQAPPPVVVTQQPDPNRTENRPQTLTEKVSEIEANRKKRQDILDAL
jgi:hypothetical protein